MSANDADPGQRSLFDVIDAPAPADANGHRIVIIDGHALAFRSYYAIRELSTSKGRPVNAVYGFVRALLRILKEEGEFDATVVTFDAPAKTFRHEQYEDYKAGRAPMPDDLPEQIRTIKELVRLLGLHQLEVPGLEADDLIGTIAKRTEAQGYAVEIVTSDRDAYQLVSDRVTVRGLDKTDKYDPERVFEKYGVRVDQWTDYRALTGDSSDNIPGAKGIGPVTAQRLLERYGTLDWILEHLDEVEPPKVAQKIRDSLEDVRFSKELSCIVTDADIDVAPERWAERELQDDPLRALLLELEFGSVLKELGLSETKAYDARPWSERPDAGALGFVLDGPTPMTSRVRGLAVASDGVVSAAETDEDVDAFLAACTRVDACDAKALAVALRNAGRQVEPGDDPLLMAYALDPGAATPEVAAQRYGNTEWGADAASRAVATSEMLASLDALLQGRQRELYERIELPLSRVLADMEATGIRIDTGLLDEQSARMHEKLEEIETHVRALAGMKDLNLNSRDQLAELLYERLELKPQKKTSTGKQSTAVSALEPLRDQHPVIDQILEYRELAKLKGTYLDPLPRLVHPDTGRLHTTFNQAVVATGRLSSTNPNLQNIPIRTAVGREIRRAFVAADGCRLLVADYSQIELRVLAHIADEQSLIDSFSRGEDIHRRTAAITHGVAPDDVTSDMRRVAKIINFGVLYGMSAHRLTRELGIEYAEADGFIKTYFEGYPNVRRYIDETLEFARENGYVETLLGRRRPIPDIRSPNRNAREYAERTAYNMPIQGTAADVMKLAMIALAPRLEPLGAKMLLQVHDELVIEAPEANCDEAATIVRDTMQGALELKVPLVAEVGVGDNWLEAK